MSSTPKKPAVDVPVTAVSNADIYLEHTADLDKAEVLQKSMPAWLTDGDLKTVQALKSAATQSAVTYSKAVAVLNRLKPLDQFCKEKLTKLLKEKWKLDVDVERDSLNFIKKTISTTGLFPVGYVTKEETVSRSLLHAAMDNFTDAQAKSGGMPKESTLVIAAVAQTGAELSPVKFAALCRELDLGSGYQRHIDQIFALPAKPAPDAPVDERATAADIRSLKLLDMQVDVHVAYLKKDISADAYKTLLSIIEQDVPAADLKETVFDGGPVIWQGLMIHDACICGALVFSKVSIDSEPKAKCIVYMPNEPRRPVYEYASLEDFKVYLTLKLQVASYRKNFTEQYLPGHDKTDFFTAFDEDKTLGVLTATPSTCPSDFFFSAFISRAQKDAQVLAVSTADVDEAQREKTLKQLLDGGLSLLNAASFFVPVLGQVLAAVAVVQIAGEVYEGVEDWTHGERHKALSHLLNVVESVAQMAAFAAAGTAVTGAWNRFGKEQTAFFDGFEAVKKADGSSRLWKPDPQPYAQLSPSGAAHADAQGIHIDGVRTSILMDGATYNVVKDAASQHWRIKHPLRPDAFQPPLERNVEGGWRHIHEHSLEWLDSAYALKRTAPRLRDIPTSRLTQLAHISGMTPTDLYRLHDSNLKLPSRFNDCVERYRLNEKINGLIKAMEAGETSSTDFIPEQLHTLPRLPNWPTDRFIEIRDDKGLVKARYPQTATEDNVNGVAVSQAQLDAGQLLDTVISGLSSKEVKGLIGATTKESKSLLLGQKIATTLKADRQPLHDWLYKQHDGVATGDVATLREHAADLPTRVAQELLENASVRDRLFLRDRKLLGFDLFGQVSAAQAGLRLDRALTGLQLPELANADTDTLALRLLDRVQGWDDGLRLEVRQDVPTGTLLDSVGKTGAPQSAVIVKTSSGYQVTQLAGTLVTTKNSKTLLEAIPHLLSGSQRTRMGLSGADHFDTVLLRERLVAVAAADPARTTRVLRGEHSEAPEHLSRCIQADSPVANTYAKGLTRKVRKLYPLYSDAEVSAFLDAAGTTDRLRANRIKELQLQWKTLRGALHAWRDDEAQMKKLPGTLNDLRVSRRQVANAIENCWRRVKPPRWPQDQAYTTLRLERNPCGALPTLSEQDVAHVRTLSIKNMNAGDELAYFLKPFKGLVRLELDNNQLTRLPEALSHMSDLEHLRLDGNKIALTEHTLRKLSDMRNLKTLGLTGNRLGATVDVSRMLDLQLLYLADTHATELPVGLARLPYLDVVNLERNEIRELPDWLFNASADFTDKLNLRHNPLSAASQAKLVAYRSRTGIGMGFAVNDITVLTEQKARDLWMPDSREENYAKRDATWTALKNEPGSDGLFRTLSEVGSTADNRYGHEDMKRRVWSVIDAAQADAALRDELLPMAVKANCDDSAALIFSNLEMRVYREAAVRESANVHDEAARLLSLGRSLFRLDYLDELAAAKAKADPKLDPVEVTLAYRTGLAEKLELVGQPRHMRFASLGGVKSTDLDTAYNKVLNAELTSDFVKSISKRDFWEEFLRKRHTTQFSRMDEPFHEEMETALEKEMPAGGENPAVTAVRQKHQKAADALVKRLTDEALKANDAKTCFAFD
ncbi:NEL-type E3 ubiquitin ligase domain-containing protein [Pseudomonas sp. Ant30-3]|uniref:NEL-type E3 ubiquitin ligase domain-containing protein n=1 Tax=Pseudomonas sp. Ant30-3 TaxID=1488328 RepID=UPI00048A51D1|nr:NEL-type E3 ubiquitin ligase domain-containing protein [Pseudomonas sp. Ant30-3]